MTTILMQGGHSLQVDLPIADLSQALEAAREDDSTFFTFAAGAVDPRKVVALTSA